MKAGKKDELAIEEAIIAISKRAGREIDRKDIGITLTVAMTQGQLEDLVVMMGFLVGQKKSASYILGNIMHDLNGLKAIHLELPEGDGFSPHSFGYAKKAKLV